MSAGGAAIKRGAQLACYSAGDKPATMCYCIAIACTSFL